MTKNNPQAVVRSTIRFPIDLHQRLKLAVINHRRESSLRVTIEQLVAQGTTELLDRLNFGEVVLRQSPNPEVQPAGERLPEMVVSKDDLQFLLSVYEGIKQPMSFKQIVGLLNLRK